MSSSTSGATAGGGSATNVNIVGSTPQLNEQATQLLVLTALGDILGDLAGLDQEVTQQAVLAALETGGAIDLDLQEIIANTGAGGTLDTDLAAILAAITGLPTSGLATEATLEQVDTDLNTFAAQNHTDLDAVNANLGSIISSLATESTLVSFATQNHTDLNQINNTLIAGLGSGGVLDLDLQQIITNTGAGGTLDTDLLNIASEIVTTNVRLVQIDDDLNTNTGAGGVLDTDLQQIITNTGAGGTLDTDLQQIITNTGAGGTLDTDLQNIAGYLPALTNIEDELNGSVPSVFLGGSDNTSAFKDTAGDFSVFKEPATDKSVFKDGTAGGGLSVFKIVNVKVNSLLLPTNAALQAAIIADISTITGTGKTVIDVQVVATAPVAGITYTWIISYT